MKTPRFLLGAALVFWGWQTGFLVPGIVMALVLEASRFVKMRWELSDDDFARIWTFCALLVFGATIYAFTNSSGPGAFKNLFADPNAGTEQSAGVTTIQTGLSLIRWLPMLFILFVAAQAYSTRQEIPLHVISLILQRRWKKAKRLGQSPPSRGMDVAWPYFVMTLLAASIHPYENYSYLAGVSVLIAWALWPRRSRRTGIVAWACTFIAVAGFGFYAQRGIIRLQQYLGSVNAQWIANWLMSRRQTDASQSRTHIGQIGRIQNSPRIVIRLWPQAGEPPVYLREASYRQYHWTTWAAETRTNDYEVITSEKDETSWQLALGKTNSARAHIACYLDGRAQSGNALGLLPLPTGSVRLEKLGAYILQKNNLGTVIAEGRGLEQFDALYGPGATIDSRADTNPVPPLAQNTTNWNYDDWSAFVQKIEPDWKRSTTNLDLDVSRREIPALEQVVAELHLRGKSRDEVMQAIAAYFTDKFTYRSWTGAERLTRTNETPLGHFLLSTHAGHCEYFATAAVLLLREVGIPARYAVGYMVHEKSGSEYVVRQRDAHAWCLVWNEQAKTWEDYDVTPPSWIAEESRRSSMVWLSDAWSWMKFQLAKLRWGQTHLREYILIGLVPVLGLLLFQIIRHQRRQRLGKGAAAKRFIAWPGLDSEFYEIEKQLIRRGITRGANEPLADWLERAAESPSLADLEAPLRALLRLHYQYRFDPNGLSDIEREELRRRCRELLAQFEQRRAENVSTR